MIDLTGTDPDDAFSAVPYEKGSAFLWYLEEMVGGPGKNFQIFAFLINLFRCKLRLFQQSLNPF